MGLIYAYDEAAMLLAVTICILFLILIEAYVCTEVNWWIFLEIFFFCQESKSFMNEGTWPNTMTSGLDTRERNQQGERGESWRLEALALASCRWKPNFARNRRCLAVAAAVRRGRRWNDQLSRASFFPSQVGSSSTKQASASTLCWVCMPAAACRPAADRLGRGCATLAYQAASISLALDS